MTTKYYPYYAPGRMFRKYLDSGGMECPFCESDNLNAGELHDDGMEIKCVNCGESWFERHKITNLQLDRLIV